MKKIFLFAILFTLTACASAQDWAKAKIEKSPRHHEFVNVKHGDREVNCFITYPEVKDKATAVIVIHEIFGLSDWARSVTDDLAAAGYIAIAPDLLSGSAAGGGGTAELIKSGAEVGQAIRKLPADQITADLNAVAEYLAKLPSCNGKVAVGGFCWGGTQTFRFATNNKDVKAALVFYGSGPEKEEDLARIKAPVYGFYGGNDNRVTSTVAKSAELMKKAGKTYEPKTYDDAGHGFMRAGEAPDPNEANKKAHDEAWTRIKELLKKL
ncbi:MAG: dienelactone hydrolase family protein [Pedosphaera sp.]|nr:dienelactone hydrolase family protein [Pedosphaera sp.]